MFQFVNPYKVVKKGFWEYHIVFEDGVTITYGNYYSMSRLATLLNAAYNLGFNTGNIYKET